MGLAQIGLLTTVIEAAETAVGAGVVLCSVAVGVWGLAARRPIGQIEEWALKGGYFGGGFGAVLALGDAALRYGV
ncbi:MAG: hypothetical protein QOF13_427 [Solirubrobacterales bacterium]|jgi:hypothetical protein|nr:hypothetical protein [Solirubrobacterales bacterium]